MLIDIATLRKLIDTDEDDFKLNFRVNAVERSIRAYTHNNFLLGKTVQGMSIDGSILTVVDAIFKVGDTVQLFHTGYQDGIYTVTDDLGNGHYKLNSELQNCSGTVGLVRYPDDVVAGAVAMIQYDIESAGREGVASESISRHSVSYVNLGSGNSIAGYPTHVTAFLKPYRRMQR